jgi:hypothetical protein
MALLTILVTAVLLCCKEKQGHLELLQWQPGIQQPPPVLQHEQSFVQLHIHFTIMLENANDATHAGRQPVTQRATADNGIVLQGWLKLRLAAAVARIGQ